MSPALPRRVVVLAGGTGGAKLARGLLDEVGEGLTVIANTGDDHEWLGVHVSPDPDLCTYWLTDEIDTERGWGIAGDSFTVFERLVALGAPEWFGLSDRDLATCLRRRELMDAGDRQTEAQRQIAAALRAGCEVLPMCDAPVRTMVRTEAGWRGFQEFMIVDRAEPEILEVRLDGIEATEPSPEVRAAIEGADAIVIGPSNPIISIGPILAVPGMRELLSEASAPVVAVSPFVAGRAVKGPTEPFMRSQGLEVSAAGVAESYTGLLDGLVVDAADPGPAPAMPGVVALPTLMDGPRSRREVAAAVLAHTATLR
ncbi:MAG: 2-phospho-L-lactate transferase [Solirubrobacterales bacterium]